MTPYSVKNLNFRSRIYKNKILAPAYMCSAKESHSAKKRVYISGEDWEKMTVKWGMEGLKKREL